MERMMIQEFIGEGKVLGKPVNQVQKDLNEVSDPEKKEKLENVDLVVKSGEQVNG